MIASGESSVNPERDLAYLTLVSSKDEAEEEVRRMSMSGAGPPPLINYVDDTDKMDLDQKPTVVPEPDDNASEATLVGEDLPPPYPGSNEEDYVMVHIDARASRTEDKENLSPNKEALPGFIGPLRAPLHNVTVNKAWDTSEKHSESIQESMEAQAPLTPPPEMPERPPPIPPRPKRDIPVKADMMMFGRQQDVTECIGNVMFQLEAAIKPEAIDENGEQIDIVKRYVM